MKWDALAVFAAVAEMESFTRAGARLGLPKSTVSRAVSELEGDLRARLFHRTTRRVRLTPAGRALFDQVGAHVTALARAATPADPDAAPSGTLRITTVPDVGAAVVAEAVARFVAIHPAVRVDVRLSHVLLDLVGEDIDVALRVTRAALPDTSHLTARRLGAIRLKVYASPRYLARAGTPRSVDDLDQHTVVAFGPMTLPGVSPRIVADDVTFTHAVVRAAGAIGVLPTFLGDPDVAAGLLVRVVPDWTAWTGTAWFVTPHGRAPPARVVAFREVLLDLLARTRMLAEEDGAPPH
jgi:DNA-binding transcriptional LysR family regulator